MMVRKNIERPCEFEEKEYEIPLYFEMLGSPGRLWSPGQVLENVAGVDCVMKASNAYSKFVGRSRKSGVTLNRLFLAMTGMPKSKAGKKQLAKLSAAAAALPLSFRVSLMVQAKRCSYYDLGRHPQKCQPLKAPKVWRTFRRTKHQQVLLEKLSAGLGISRKTPHTALAEVTYAAPSFHERIDLWRSTAARRMMTRSTFPPAVALSGHVRWAYNAPGAIGTALSEPVDVEGEPLATRLDRLFESEGGEVTPASVVEQLEHLDRLTREAVMEAQLKDVDEVTAEGDEELPREGFLAARVAARLGRHGIAWMIVGPEHEGPAW